MELVKKLFFLLFFGLFGGRNCEIIYEWKKSDLISSLSVRSEYCRATSFAIIKNNIFLTLLDSGKNITGNGVVLAFDKSGSKSPEGIVFPHRDLFKMYAGESGRLISPISVRRDDCDRLWILDSAVENVDRIQKKTDPGIYVFDSENGRPIRNFRVPASQWSTSSFFVSFIVDTSQSDRDCRRSFGYFADFNRFRILTYDFQANVSLLKSHPFFSPDPLVHIPNGALFNPKHQDVNGIFGLALSGRHAGTVDGFRDLYFHPLAATHEFKMSTRVLKSPGRVNYQDVRVFMDKGENSESGISVLDPETDTLFFAEVNTKRLGVFQLRNLNLKPKGYFRYDFNVGTGFIVDLFVTRSELWILVDQTFEIAIHKLYVPDILKHFSSMRRNDQIKNNGSNVQFFLLPLLSLIVSLQTLIMFLSF